MIVKVYVASQVFKQFIMKLNKSWHNTKVFLALLFSCVKAQCVTYLKKA